MLLTLSLVPGVGLGPFRLGLELNAALTYFKEHCERYRAVDVTHSDQADEDILLALPEHGFHLRFEPRGQRLRLVEVTDLSRLQVACGAGRPAAVFGGVPSAPSLSRLLEVFGPTFPGEAGAACRTYPLLYPGVAFLFPLAPGAAPASDGHVVAGGEAGSQFPVPPTTVASRIILYHGSADSLAAALASPLPPTTASSLEAVPLHGLRLGGGSRGLLFGDSPQDAAAELGPPDRVASLAGSSLGAGAAAGGRYMWCYPALGLDLVFGGGTGHELDGVVLHTNAPGHLAFGEYRKAAFRILVGLGDGGAPSAAPGATEPADAAPAATEQPAATADSALPSRAPELAGRPPRPPSSTASLVETASLAASRPTRKGKKGKKGQAQRAAARPPAYGGSADESSSAADSGRESPGLGSPPVGGGFHQDSSMRGSSAASLASSDAELDAKEGPLPRGSSAYDGWSDAESLSALALEITGGAGSPADWEDQAAPPAAPAQQQREGSRPAGIHAPERAHSGQAPHVLHTEDGELIAGSPRRPRAVLTPESTLPEIEAAFGGGGRPALHAPPAALGNACGSTLLHGFRGAVFELLPSGRLASVQLLRP